MHTWQALFSTNLISNIKEESLIQRFNEFFISNLISYKNLSFENSNIGQICN